MNHLEKTKIFFGLKDKYNSFIHSILYLTFLLVSCSSNKYQRISIENPIALVAMEDSLLKIESNEKLYNSLSVAHSTIGKTAYDNNDFLKAKNRFTRALSLVENDTSSLHYYYLIEGHILLKKGNKNGLWEGIGFYYKAAKLKPSLGEPYFFIGKSYQKLGDSDFDLIAESFENALKLTLTKDLRDKINLEYNNIIDRKNRLENFWK